MFTQLFRFLPNPSHFNHQVNNSRLINRSIKTALNTKLPSTRNLIVYTPLPLLNSSRGSGFSIRNLLLLPSLRDHLVIPDLKPLILQMLLENVCQYRLAARRDNFSNQLAMKKLRGGRSRREIETSSHLWTRKTHRSWNIGQARSIMKRGRGGGGIGLGRVRKQGLKLCPRSNDCLIS